MVAVTRFVSKYWMPLSVVIFLMVSGLWGFILGKRKADKVMDSIDEKDADITDLEARALADRLWREFDGLGGSDGDVIKGILKGVSLPDFKKIAIQFGQRYRDDILGAEGGWLLGNSKRDLIYWLGAELSDSERSELKRENPDLPI